MNRNELLQRLQAIKDLGNLAVLNSPVFPITSMVMLSPASRLQITLALFMSALTLESDAILPVAR